MDGMIVEIIVTTFTLGGIIGAAAALSLSSSRLWHKTEDLQARSPRSGQSTRNGAE